MTMDDARKAQLINKLNSNRAALMAELATYGEDDWSRVVYADGVEWRATDVLRHLADSERGMTALMVQVQAGGEGVPPDFDLHRWNQRAVTKQAERTPAELLAGMDTSREQLLAFIDGLDESDWDKRGRHASLRIMSIEEVCNLIADHEADHLSEIRAAAGP